MSYLNVVEKTIDGKIAEYKEGQANSDSFDSAIFSVMIAVLVDLKNDLGLD